MPIYVVRCEGVVTEWYEVEADSEADAMARWCDGVLTNSEASTDPVSATCDDED